MKYDREILKQHLTKSMVLTLVKWKNQADEFCIMVSQPWSLHLVNFSQKIRIFEHLVGESISQKISIALDAGLRRLVKINIKSSNKRIYDMFRT